MPKQLKWEREVVSGNATETTGYISVQSLSRVWLFATPNCSTPGLPVYHQLPESTQTHVHWVGDAIQPYEGEKNLDPYLMITQKLRCTRDVNIKPKTIKLLEENIWGKYFLDWI